MRLALVSQDGDVGASNVTERDFPGHLLRYAGSKSTDLFMDVVQESVGRPPTLLLDVQGSTAVEVHGHGARLGLKRSRKSSMLGVEKFRESLRCKVTNW